MKIYTRTGDKGTTALFGAGRVSKHDPRIETYGTVDETNTFLGAARAEMTSVPDVAKLDDALQRIQRSLFVLGSDLATPSESRAKISRLSDEEVDYLETMIDELEADLPPLKNFILPGGTPSGAHLHIARTICRRAERRASALSEIEEVNPVGIKYLNRLSDFLFVAGRWINHKAGVPEDIWSGSE